MAKELYGQVDKDFLMTAPQMNLRQTAKSFYAPIFSSELCDDTVDFGEQVVVGISSGETQR